MKNTKEEIQQTMDFLGMLGFLPSKSGEKTARKWLNMFYQRAYTSGKIEGLELLKKIRKQNK